jgi:hypothetical protein
MGTSVSKENTAPILRVGMPPVSRGLVVVCRSLVRIADVAYRKEGAWRGVAVPSSSALCPIAYLVRLWHHPNRLLARRGGGTAPAAQSKCRHYERGNVKSRSLWPRA